MEYKTEINTGRRGREKGYVPPSFTQLLTQKSDLLVFTNEHKTFFKPNSSTLNISLTKNVNLLCENPAF